MKPYFVKVVNGNLSLCTREGIKIGDNVINGATGDEEIVIPDMTDRGRLSCKGLTDPYEVVQCDSFKVIGEISPKAKWVKEGMEFDKDEVEISKLPLCPKCGAAYNDGFCPEEQDCEIGKKRIVVKILGDCEHFH